MLPVRPTGVDGAGAAGHEMAVEAGWLQPCVSAPDPAAVLRHAFRSLNAVVRPLVEAGVGNPLRLGIGPLVVETTGRVSGQPRRVPLLSARIGDTVYVSTVRPDSQWMKNLVASPAAKVRLFGRDREATTVVGRVGGLQIATLTLHP